MSTIIALVNGNEVEFPVESTVDDVVRATALSITGCAAAVNGDVVPKSTWSRVKVQAGDRIEILSAAPGG